MENTEQIPQEQEVVQQPEVQAPAESQSDWQVHLIEATGGRVKTAEELTTVFSEFDEYKSKATQMADKWEKLDPRIKKMAEMREAGAGDDDIDRWYSLQKLDVTKLSEIDAIRQKIKMEMPTLSDTDINDFLEEKYGDLESLAGAKKVELIQAANEAKKFLQSQIIAAEPKALQDKQTQELKYQEYLGEVQSAIGSFKSTNHLNEISLVTEGVDVEGGKIETKIPIPSEIQEQVYKYTAEQIASQGVKPTKEAVQQTMNNYLWALYGQQISEARVKDAVAKAKKEGIKENAGRQAKPDVVANAAKTESLNPFAFFAGK